MCVNYVGNSSHTGNFLIKFFNTQPSKDFMKLFVFVGLLRYYPLTETRIAEYRQKKGEAAQDIIL